MIYNILCLQLEMGVYLSTPKTDKFSEDGENDTLRYGLSSMQGWRASMEDAVSTQNNFFKKIILSHHNTMCVTCNFRYSTFLVIHYLRVL